MVKVKSARIVSAISEHASEAVADAEGGERGNGGGGPEMVGKVAAEIEAGFGGDAQFANAIMDSAALTGGDFLVVFEREFGVGRRSGSHNWVLASC